MKHLAFILVILLPAISGAFDVPVKLAWDAQNGGRGVPEHYNIYMCNAPLFYDSTKKVTSCRSRALQIEESTSTIASVVYRAPSSKGTLYIVVTSVGIVDSQFYESSPSNMVSKRIRKWGR